MAALAGHLVEAHHVTLITLTPTAHDFYPVDPRVKRVALDLLAPSTSPLGALARLVRTVRALRQALIEAAPTICVTFVDRTNIETLLAAAGRWPVVVAERVDPRRYKVGRLWGMLRRLTYRRAARLVVQTEAVRAWAAGLLPARRIAVIPNPVDPSWTTPRIDGRRRWIAMMGRFVPQKRFDLGVEAFSRIADQPAWQLVLMGDGPLRPSIREQVRALGLSERVLEMGPVRDPERILRQSAIFLLSSDFEGFPNALLEAMACGCAVVSTDCPSGPGEIVRDGTDGVLVPVGDVARMSEALSRLMQDASARETLGRRAAEVSERFAPGRVFAMWEKCLRDAADEAMAVRSGAGEPQ